ncbi:MAG TPA: YdeI/OmpD-associated family protein [Candidatus Dormibacteraeota bacterium]|nr:YdeI/OmpD-associated family protein [Candidatus Dormibacteraeota bacterium]
MASPRSVAPGATPIFFATPSAFREWLELHHSTAREQWIGLHKKDSGKPSITWPEAVDAALCFGWIDGLRKRIDETSYMNRFTPRKTRSNWSVLNLKRVSELCKLGLMRPAGLRVFESRSAEKSQVYSYERRKTAKLGKAFERQFRGNKKAWEFFCAQPPGYQRVATWWVVSAKREETRLKRLATLIKDSEHGRRIAHLTSPAAP